MLQLLYLKCHSKEKFETKKKSKNTNQTVPQEKTSKIKTDQIHKYVTSYFSVERDFRKIELTEALSFLSFSVAQIIKIK